MLNDRLNSFANADVRSFLEELEQVTGLSISGHAEFTLLSFLTLCQRDVWRDKKQRIDAAHFYPGSMLKTKVEKLPPSILGIVTVTARRSVAVP